MGGIKINRFLGGFVYAITDGEAACEKCHDQFTDAATHLREEHLGRYLLAKISPRRYRPNYL